jgi:excisionase family DNA binding protein
MMSAQQSPWVSLTDAATHLSVGRSTMYEWIRAGIIPPNCYARVAGSRYKFSIKRLDEWLETYTPNSTGTPESE